MAQAARRQPWSCRWRRACGLRTGPGALRGRDLKRVTVDTKASFPTDAKLLHAAIKGLNRLARRKWRQAAESYSRLAKDDGEPLRPCQTVQPASAAVASPAQPARPDHPRMPRKSYIQSRIGMLAALDRGRQERIRSRRQNEARQKWGMLELNRAPIISACLLRRTTEANGRVPAVDVQPMS